MKPVFTFTLLLAVLLAAPAASAKPEEVKVEKMFLGSVAPFGSQRGGLLGKDIARLSDHICWETGGSVSRAEDGNIGIVVVPVVSEVALGGAGVMLSVTAVRVLHSSQWREVAERLIKPS